MRRKKILMVVIFCVALFIVCVQNRTYEKSLIKDTGNYAEERLNEFEHIINKYFDLLEEVIESLDVDEINRTSVSNLDNINTSEVYKILDGFEILGPMGFSAFIYLDNGYFFSTKTKETNIDIVLDDIEKKTLDELYNDIEFTQTIIKKDVGSNEKGKFLNYLGAPIINDMGEFVGIKVIEIRDEAFSGIINTDRKEKVNFDISIEEKGNQVYETLNFATVAKGHYTAEDIINKYNYYEKAKLKTTESANMHNIFTEYYIVRRIICIVLVFVGIYVIVKIKKDDSNENKNKNENKKIDFLAIIVLDIVFIIIAISNAVVYNYSATKLKDSRSYTMLYSIKLGEELERNFRTMYPRKIMDAIKNVIEHSNIPDTMVYDVTMQMFGDKLEELVKWEKNNGHIYFYDVNKNMKMIPQSMYQTYVEVDDKWFSYEEYLKNEVYYQIYYDENLKNNMCVFAIPVARDEKIIGVFAFIYDYDNIVLNLLKGFEKGDIQLSYLNKNLMAFDYDGSKLVRTNKTLHGDNKFDTNEKTKSATIDCNVDSTYYQGLKKREKDKTKCFFIDSFFLDGRIIAYTDDSSDISRIVVASLFMILSLTLLNTLIILFDKKEDRKIEKRKTLYDKEHMMNKIIKKYN